MATTTVDRPMALLAELTYRCPLQCPYCSNPVELGKYSEELDTETWLRVLREAADLGVVQAHFSGGEPLLRKDLAELVREARALDIYTDLSTGATLATKERLAELKEAGLDGLQLSVLDPRADQNDWLAGTKSFEQKCAAFEFAKELDFPVTLNIVLHRHNLDAIEEIIALARDWAVERVEFAHVQYTGWAYENRAALLPTRAQLERAQLLVSAFEKEVAGQMRVLHVLPDYYQDVPKGCLQGWGSVFLTVAPDGAVLPCQTAREIPTLEFPNVKTQDLESIWFHAPVFQKFRGTDWLPEPCRDCERKEIDFGGCRCQAFLLTGDAGVTDPVCTQSPHHQLVEAAIAAASEPSTDFQYRVMRR